MVLYCYVLKHLFFSFFISRKLRMNASCVQISPWTMNVCSNVTIQLRTQRMHVYYLVHMYAT
jgi:hypothetical protein